MPTVILTRPKEDAERSRSLFSWEGVEVVSVPLVEFTPLPLNRARIVDLLQDAPAATLLTSGRAAELWFSHALTDYHPPDQRYLVVGERAAEVIRVQDPSSAVVTVQPDGASLLRWLDANSPIPRRILYPCSLVRTDSLVDGLRARGVDLDELPLYEPTIPHAACGHLESVLVSSSTPIALLFHSSTAVLNFFRCRVEFPPGTIFAAIGATSAAPLRERGIEPLVPDTPTDRALARSVADAFGSYPSAPTA